MVLRYSQNLRDSVFSVLVGIKNYPPVVFDPFRSFSGFLSFWKQLRKRFETVLRFSNPSRVFQGTDVWHASIFNILNINFFTPTKGSKIMTKPRALPTWLRPEGGGLSHTYAWGSKIRDRDERSRNGRNWLCGSVLRIGKRWLRPGFGWTKMKNDWPN